MRRVLVVAVVALAGCGGGGGGDKTTSTADFKRQFAPLDAQLKATGLAVGKAFQTASGKTDARVAADFDKVSAQVGTVNGRLAKLTAPDAVSTDYATLQRNLDTVKADLAAIADDARAHDAAKAKADSKKTVLAAAKIKPVANRVRKAVGLKQTP